MCDDDRPFFEATDVKLPCLFAVIALMVAVPNFSSADTQAPRNQVRGRSTAVQFVRRYLEETGFGREANAKSFPNSPTTVAIARIAGTKITLAYLQGAAWCGTGGCHLFVLKAKGASFEIIGDIPITWEPILSRGLRGDGYPEIAFWVHGGGIMRPYEAAVDAKNGGYSDDWFAKKRVPSNTGLVLIPADDRGTILFR